MRFSSLCLVALAAGCSGASSAPAPSAPPPARAVAAASNAPAWIYEVKAAPRAASLAIDAQFPAGSLTDFAVGDLGSHYVKDVVLVESGRQTPITMRGDGWSIPACAKGCHVTYTFELRAAAGGERERSMADARGDAVESPPSTWLLHPRAAPDGTLFRFHVTSPPGETFVSGVFPVAGAPDTYEARMVRPFDYPYSAFGPIRRVPIADGHIEVAYLPGTYRDPAAVAAWTERSAEVVRTYYGIRPIERTLLMIRPSRGVKVGFGATMGMSGSAIDISVGSDIGDAGLKDDWVLVHEMIHTALPDLDREHHWLEEGLATYVEPIARARFGLVTPERTWRDWIGGMPQGEPEDGDQGLDNTHTWGRTYWGGALFCLAADVAIREQTKNQRSIDDALRAVLDEGGNIAVHWPIKKLLATLDRGTGTNVISDLYARMATKAEKVDLPALWKRLGVAVNGDRIVYDDRAPLAFVRLAMLSSSR